MKKWVKIKEGETKVEAISDSSNINFLKKIGFVEMDVEESEKGGWYLMGYAPKFSEEEIAAKELEKAKVERAESVSKIIVEVDGMKFDGDETSQDRMARSIVALNDGETVQWVLADNTIAQVTKEQLRQALRLAGEAQTAIWADPYLTSTTNS
jgi:hypothetical protein